MDLRERPGRWDKQGFAKESTPQRKASHLLCQQPLILSQGGSGCGLVGGFEQGSDGLRYSGTGQFKLRISKEGGKGVFKRL